MHNDDGVTQHDSHTLANTCRWTKMCSLNRPFLSSLAPLFQNKSKCETFHMKMSSGCSLILMQIKVIFITMVSHLDSF